MLSQIESIHSDGQLSVSAYIVLALLLFIIVGGLSWCFYRAIKATSSDEEQLAGEE